MAMSNGGWMSEARRNPLGWTALVLSCAACNSGGKGAGSGAEAESGDALSCSVPYPGPPAGKIQEKGSVAHECPTGATAGALPAVDNACTWKVIRTDDGSVVDEGACPGGLANEAEGFATYFGQQTIGVPGSKDFTNFSFRIGELGTAESVAKTPLLWCDYSGLEVVDGAASPELPAGVHVDATYEHAGTGGFASVSCRLATFGPPGSGQLTIESVQRRCWFTNSYLYEVHGSASLECQGTLAGDFSVDVPVRIEVGF